MKVGKGVSGGKPPEPPWGALSSPQRRCRSPQKGVPLRAARRLHNLTAAPRIDSRGGDPGIAWGEAKTHFPTNPKWQIGLGLWQKVARRETERSAASAKRAARDGYSFQFNRVCVPSLEPDCVRFLKFCWNPGGIPKGAALGAPLVTFPATGKSPGCRAERLHLGECRGAKPLAKAPLLRGRGETLTLSPHKQSARKKFL